MENPDVDMIPPLDQIREELGKAMERMQILRSLYNVALKQDRLARERAERKAARERGEQRW